MQLKFFAAFSASAFVSKSARVPFVWELPENPISENAIEITMEVKTDLRLFIYLGLSSSSRFKLINFFRVVSKRPSIFTSKSTYIVVLANC